MTPPRLKTLKKGIAHGRFSYSESEKHAHSKDTPIFAYMRRSTSKKEQEESIEQQQEGIQHLSQELGIDLSKIRAYSETKSGFENRSREEWKRMIKDIDATNEPCILLCRDTSRLSRNPRDNLVIADRIFGDKIGNKRTKKTIGSIYFLGDNFQIQEWNERSDKKYIVDKLHQNYIESLETKTKSVNGHILKLQAGIYPYHPAPKGLEHIIVKGKKILSQNDKMPFVRHAFEMKVERKGHKEIAKYLKQFGGIKIGEKELTDRYFTNTVYIGEYTEQNTGQVFKNLLFAEGKPPISLVLWDKVQDCLSKRGRIYRNDSEKDIFEERGKTEEGGLLARDIKKKKTRAGEAKYTYYKNTKAKVNISQDIILEVFKKELEKVIYRWSMPYILHQLNSLSEPTENKRLDDFVNQEITKLQTGFPHINQMGKLSQATLSSFFTKVRQTSDERRKEWESHYNKTISDLLEKLFKEHPEFEKDKDIYQRGMDSIKYFAVKKTLLDEDSLIETTNNFVKTFFSLSPNIRESEEIRKAQKSEIQKLEQQKQNLEEERKQYRRRAVLAGMSGEEIEDVSREIDRSISIVQEEIQELGENTDMENFLERLPKILSEIVELSSEALITEENEKKKENIIKLFEMTVSNFSISNKKELKIKLFEVLDTLVNGGNVGMEAPSGVEPDYKALQASA